MEHFSSIMSDSQDLTDEQKIISDKVNGDFFNQVGFESDTVVSPSDISKLIPRLTRNCSLAGYDCVMGERLLYGSSSYLCHHLANIFT